MDTVYGVAVDALGNVYAGGGTYGSFPVKNALIPTPPGWPDGFLAKLTPSGSELVYATYLGGLDTDVVMGVAADANGYAYATGQTKSPDFPVSNAMQPIIGGGADWGQTTGDGYVVKITPGGNAFVYSTFLGGKYFDWGQAIAADSHGNAYVTGTTTSEDFPIISDTPQTSYGGRYAFYTQLSADGRLIASNFVGTTYDYGNAIAVDKQGNVIVAGVTQADSFPTKNPSQAQYGGSTDGFVAKIAPTQVSSALELTLPEGGAASRSTVGIGSDTQVGYATATVASGTSPYGVAVFSFKQNNVVVSEAAVPASPPTTSARICVDYRSGVPAMPGRSDAGSVDISTGMAIVNPGIIAANVTYTLRNKIGTPVATGHGTLAGGAHFAKFVNQLKEVAPDFDIPSDFPTATQFGSLDVASDRPLSVLALRLTMNQRNEALLTSTPIADLTKPLGSLPLYFPQFVDGGGYLTTLILLNTSNAAESGRLALFSDSGAPLMVNQIGGTRDSTFSYSIQPGGVFVFETDGSPVDANAGSVQLKPDANTSSPVGAGIFSFLQGGVRVTESGVPSASPTTHARIYIDQSGNHGTGLAIANPGTSGANATLKAFQTDGSTIAGTSAGVDLMGNGHTARFVSQLISGLPADFRGVLDMRSSSPFVAVTLRSLTNSRDNFLLTTFPIADGTQPAPAPIVFPQIADGGGYTTEFILLSPVGASTVTLGFYGEDGTPLAVGK
jgi:hypothetical protein